MNNSYSLRLYDDELLTFSLEEKGLEGLKSQILSVNEDKKNLFPLDLSYESICAEVMGTKQKNQLRKLIDFKFTRHPSINLPEEHLVAIEKHIQSRVRKLLALPTASK